jgi:catechol 2,3-dioxygenase-like lactoylglutathione lyase family enzyme
MIQELAFVVYPVSDMDRARRFYERTLGLLVETNFQNEWVEYDLKGVTFAITKADAEHQPGAGGALVAFEVDDLEFVLERLRFLGVKLVKGSQTTPVCRFAVIHDPDGNELVIHQRKS